MNIMRKRVGAAFLCASLAMGIFAGCSAEQQEQLDKALEGVGSAMDFAGDALSGAAEKAKDAVNYAGDALNINGEYGSTMDMLSAYGDKFKAEVTNKLEEINCGEYITTLNESIDSMKNLKEDLTSALQETSLVDTESYKFFSNFDMNKYDITFTAYTYNESFNRCRVIKDNTNGNLNTYTSMFIFDKTEAEKSDSVFDLLGLVFSSADDNVWYTCNQVLKTKEVATQPSEYKAWETILKGYQNGTFKSSTLNNLISQSGVSVDSFVVGDATVDYIFKDSQLIGAIYITGEKTDYVYITVNDFGDKSEKLITAVESYKLQD